MNGVGEGPQSARCEPCGRFTASHLGAAISLQTSLLAGVLARGDRFEPLGSGSPATVPDQYFRAQDGTWFAVSVLTEAQWQTLLFDGTPRRFALAPNVAPPPGFAAPPEAARPDNDPSGRDEYSLYSGPRKLDHPLSYT